jgi:thioredoxin reductase (NADPH)
VDDERETLERIERLLTRRLGADYEIVVDSSPARALAHLQERCNAEADVAVILAAHGMREMRGTEFLARAQRLYPHAKRAVMIGIAEMGAARDDILRAAAVGEIDTYVGVPSREPDEAFYRAVAQFLDVWDRAHRPQFETLRIVGDAWDPHVIQLRDALERSGVPAGLYLPEEAGGRQLLEEAGMADQPLPVVITADGRAVSRPSNSQVAELMHVNVDPTGHDYDVAIVGAGPAGLAAAVYAASEGLDVLVIDNEALGGQASTSTAIRNYLGFPRGVSGSELAVRAYWQAWFFGARFLIGREVRRLSGDGDWRTLALDDGSIVRARSVVLASGVAYRRLGLESVEQFVGRGVFYGAPVTEGPAMAGERVLVIGGGNSSAQTALFLAGFAAHVSLIVRRAQLDEMSAYLIRDIENHPNIEIRLSTVVVDAAGDTRLRSVTVHDQLRDVREEVPAAALFILIGAEPRTDWLPAEIERDERGYIVTGAEISRPTDGDRLPLRLETSMSGVFAVGDVRLGSLKRVAAAVGEGSSAIRHVHDYLALLSHRPHAQ